MMECPCEVEVEAVAVGGVVVAVAHVDISEDIMLDHALNQKVWWVDHLLMVHAADSAEAVLVVAAAVVVAVADQAWDQKQK